MNVPGKSWCACVSAFVSPSACGGCEAAPAERDTPEGNSYCQRPADERSSERPDPNPAPPIERERVARIIDPGVWESKDDFDARGLAGKFVFSWNRDLELSLTKADAILSGGQPERERVAIEALRRLAALATDLAGPSFGVSMTEEQAHSHAADLRAILSILTLRSGQEPAAATAAAPDPTEKP